MNEFQKWLLTPSRNYFSKVENILICWFCCFMWVFFWIHFINMLNPVEKEKTFSDDYSPLFKFFNSCILAPLWEELLFRYVPIEISRKLKNRFLMPILVGSSILFGLAHGNYGISVLIQGVMGFFFACLYIKNGYSLKSSIFIHFMWNFYCLV